MGIFDRFFGNPNKAKLAQYEKVNTKINSFEEVLSKLSDDELSKKTTEFKNRIKEDQSLDDLLPEAFAVVRESSRRTLGLRHYDVQLIGGQVMHNNGIAEMRTGEGKTLVVTLPAYLNALSGKGVHVITVNDYLAKRDAAWVGQVYTALGLTVGVINSGQSYIYDENHIQDEELDKERDEDGSFKIHYEFLRPVDRKEAYEADITYGTNSEFGFDYLRDNIQYDKDKVVQKGHHIALIDEVDSILIDEARTPLIISAPVADSESLYKTFSRVADKLVEGEDYEVDEKMKSIQISESGIEKTEQTLGLDNIYTEKGIKYVHHLETAVRAKALFKREKEYVVRDGNVVIVDPSTGRLQPSRRWSEGLHQAIEAKEGVDIQQESRTFASITYQNYFRMYEKLAGMTGTAETSSEEFFKVYSLDVIPIPTNKPIAREDLNDQIFQTEIGKFNAVARKVKELNKKGQPVLIGTASIDKNELLSEFLKKEGIQHTVLNAKNHEQEGQVIAQAGKKGAVTVATNMAGRGIDIKLGGNPSTEEEGNEVRELGGLFVLGTERHEARRIDNQLRGRAGRQGDKGGTQFFVSLEDSLMRIFASDTVKNMMGRFNFPEDQAIESKIINKSLESAQEKVEGFHFDSRKHVLDYDNVLNTQRESIYQRRNNVLFGEKDVVDAELMRAAENNKKLEDLVKSKREEMGEEEFYKATRNLILQIIDMLWVEHLEMMDYMRSSVRLRAYGQRDPLVEYKKEGLILFKEMQEALDHKITELLPNIGNVAVSQGEKDLKEIHKSAKSIGSEKTSGSSSTHGALKVGRNDKVEISNGTETKVLKYKKAEPLLYDGWKIVKVLDEE